MSLGPTRPHASTSPQAAGEGRPGIVWVFPELAGRAMPFGADRVVLGREGDGAGRLEGTELSRQHAEIRRQGLLTLLRDLGSTNGTFVNGRKVSKVLLSDGDTLTIGRVHFVVNAAAGSPGRDPEPTWTS